MGEFGGQLAYSTLNTDCEFEVPIDITCIYDLLLLIHEDITTPPLLKLVLQTTTLRPTPPPIYNVGLVSS